MTISGLRACLNRTRYAGEGRALPDRATKALSAMTSSTGGLPRTYCRAMRVACAAVRGDSGSPVTASIRKDWEPSPPAPSWTSQRSRPKSDRRVAVCTWPDRPALRAAAMASCTETAAAVGAGPAMGAFFLI